MITFDDLPVETRNRIQRIVVGLEPEQIIDGLKRPVFDDAYVMFTVGLTCFYQIKDTFEKISIEDPYWEKQRDQMVEQLNNVCRFLMYNSHDAMMYVLMSGAITTMKLPFDFDNPLFAEQGKRLHEYLHGALMDRDELVDDAACAVVQHDYPYAVKLGQLVTLQDATDWAIQQYPVVLNWFQLSNWFLFKDQGDAVRFKVFWG